MQCSINLKCSCAHAYKLIDVLPMLSTMLVVLFTVSLDVGVTVTLGWTELETLTSRLLE